MPRVRSAQASAMARTKCGNRVALLLGPEGDEHEGVRRDLRDLILAAVSISNPTPLALSVYPSPAGSIVVGADDEPFGRLTLLDGDDVGGVHGPPALPGREELLGRGKYPYCWKVWKTNSRA